MFRPSAILLLLAASASADLVATFTKDGATDTRIDRFPALALTATEPVTPFLSPGKFQATWKGKIAVPHRLRLVFSFEGEGKAVLKIAGKEVLTREGKLDGEASKSTRLNQGEHDFELVYDSLPDGAASFRIFWEEPSFPRQSIPASAFKAEKTEAVTLGELQRHGRHLFAVQSCAKCHLATLPVTMPEFGDVAPLLAGTGVGERLTEEWLRRWLAEPHAIKPNTHMPDLVDASTEEGRQQVSDLAAYLASEKLGMPAGAPVDEKLSQAGGAHFHELGCVACHNPPDKEGGDPTRVPLNNVASKYLPGALVTFLKDPAALHTGAKMPNFRLSDEEANSIAAFLTVSSKGKETKLDMKFPTGDAARGKELAAAMQCGTCHPGIITDPTKAPLALDAVFKKDWTASGCVAPEDKRGKTIPHLNITDKDREALVAFQKSGPESLARDTPSEYVTRQVEALRCTSCHAMDGIQPLLNGYHKETEALVAHITGVHERVDQTRPQLTYTGEMLYTTAIEEMIAGTSKTPVRPWLAMRMPSFTTRAKGLAEGFSKLHGLSPNKPSLVSVDVAMAAIGKDLAGTAGFGCTTCHGVGDLKPTAAFEVEGVNFKLVPDRIREEYYHRWMDNPQTTIPGTKMPRYSKDGKSQRTDVLDGDAKKQFDAIWQYIHSAK